MISYKFFYLIFLISICSIISCDQEREYSNPISEEVKFKNAKDNVELSGTLSIPDKKGVFPVVILISGNGEHNRDEEFGKFKPFLDISNYMMKQGIAVLRYDKRGVGESTGDYNAATSFDLAEDVQSAIEFVLSRKEIDEDRIGLIGHSEGGLIAPIVASQSSNVAFIVSLAGPSISGNQVLLSQQEAIAKAKGMDTSKVNQLIQLNKDAFDIVRDYTNQDQLTEKMTQYIEAISLNDPDKPESMTYQEYVDAQVNGILRPWMINFLRYNPEEYIRQVECPVLALNGSKDLQVLADINLREWKRILEESGNQKVSIRELPDMNHLFQSCKTGLPDEYETLDESISLIVLKEVSEWVKSII